MDTRSQAAPKQHPGSYAATHGPTLGAHPPLPPPVGGGVLVLVWCVWCPCCNGLVCVCVVLLFLPLGPSGGGCGVVAVVVWCVFRLFLRLALVMRAVPSPSYLVVVVVWRVLCLLLLLLLVVVGSAAFAL